MSELIDDTANSLPDVLGVTEALDSVWDLSLNTASEQTLKDLSHSEEGEVDVGSLHGLELVHLVVLLVVDLVEELLPVVVEVEEELFVLDHLGLSVEEHGGSLSEVLSRVKEVAHSVVMETLSDILEDVDSVDDPM